VEYIGWDIIMCISVPLGAFLKGIYPLAKFQNSYFAKFGLNSLFKKSYNTLLLMFKFEIYSIHFHEITMVPMALNKQL
jgi:hypothetical protein